ncbi:MAG: hypothetical protein KC582_01370 [Candidatus Magasanikbacteria bacterium]|nr:hypothetical protein [Candidatus Magasanikbacteria bacterium]MCA9390884.1 hypothetical protein [Candidatus Magasanikbacteria bacterium]
MLAQIGIISGFLEKVGVLNTDYPEVFDSNFNFRLSNYDTTKLDLLHSGMYDVRLFKAMTNDLRSLISLKKDKIHLSEVHKVMVDRYGDSPFLSELKNKKTEIDNYLGKGADEALPNVSLRTVDTFYWIVREEMPGENSFSLKMRSSSVEPDQSTLHKDYNRFSAAPLGVLTVAKLLEEFFAACIQHSQPGSQELMTDLNLSCNGNLAEVVRHLCMEVVRLLDDYGKIIKRIQKIAQN